MLCPHHLNYSLFYIASNNFITLFGILYFNLQLLKNYIYFDIFFWAFISNCYTTPANLLNDGFLLFLNYDH